MKIVNRLIPVAMVSLAVSSAFAIVRRDDVSDQDYIDFGATFTGVGRVLGNSGAGSGTLIGSRWVLTATHVVNGNGGLEFRVGGGVYGVANVYQKAGYNAGDLVNGNDIALLELSSDVAGVDIYDLYYDQDEVGKNSVTVGFGNRGTGSTGFIGGTYGTRRAGTNVIDQLWDGRGGALLHDFDDNAAGDNTTGADATTSLEHVVAPGDSGGALFIEDNGNYRLAGVTSVLGAIDGAANGDYGDVSGFTRVSNQDTLDWIENTSGVPEPATMTILGLGALAAWRKKRSAKK